MHKNKGAESVLCHGMALGMAHIYITKLIMLPLATQFTSMGINSLGIGLSIQHENPQKCAWGDIGPILK